VWRRRESRREPLEDELRRLLATDGARVLVGTLEGVPVGYAVARVERLADGTAHGVVDDIYVEPEARGVGLGEALMGDLVAWCTEQGCTGMDAMALPGDRHTKNFFEASGFTARKLVMYHSLARDGG
jgi:GNAT superfamily N-acetyltransferase